MAVIRILCWALIFIIKLRFPRSLSLADIWTFTSRASPVSVVSRIWMGTVQLYFIAFVAYETTLAEGIHFEKKLFYSTFATVSLYIIIHIMYILYVYVCNMWI